jgi:hypothetical protein
MGIKFKGLEGRKSIFLKRGKGRICPKVIEEKNKKISIDNKKEI